eukprot:2326554-Amphidinium_carterae.1
MVSLSTRSASRMVGAVLPPVDRVSVAASLLHAALPLCIPWMVKAECEPPKNRYLMVAGRLRITLDVRPFETKGSLRRCETGAYSTYAWAQVLKGSAKLGAQTAVGAAGKTGLNSWQQMSYLNIRLRIAECSKLTR